VAQWVSTTVNRPQSLLGSQADGSCRSGFNSDLEGFFSAGQIYANDRRVLHFNALARGDPLRISR